MIIELNNIQVENECLEAVTVKAGILKLVDHGIHQRKNEAFIPKFESIFRTASRVLASFLKKLMIFSYCRTSQFVGR